MLTLGSPRRWVTWDAGGIDLLLSPLTEDRNADFVRECVLLIDGPDGEPRLERDSARYARMVGAECIHDWRRVLGTDGNPVPHSAERAGELMLIRPAQAFIIEQVRGLSLWLAQEAGAAKKG